MELSLHILAVTALILFSALGTRFLTHMFQLNSYTAHVQIAWMRKNVRALLPFGILCIAAVLCAFLETAAGYAAFAVAALLLAFCYLPKEAKKPLVYTARVKRLLATYGLICTALTALAVFLPGRGEFVLFGITVVLEPWILMLSNLINAPIEAAVRRYYIRDAKKILSECKNLKIIGVTGSYGKTSVKYFLSALLRVKYNVLMTPESYNTPMGVVKTIRSSLRATHNIFVCEMGAKYVGDIKELCDIVHPKDGVVTSIGEQHLESFGSVDNIIKTKYELAGALPENGNLFINIASKTIDENRPPRSAVTYGLMKSADYYAKDIEVTGEGTTFTLCHGDEEQRYSTRLIGEANVINIVGAIAVANTYGIALCDLCSAVRTLKCVPHRMELIDRGEIIIIDDAFNSNPAGARAALETLSRFDAVKCIITPGMIELGAREDELNAKLGMEAAKVCDYIVLVGEKQTKPIYSGALDGGFDKSRIFVAPTFKEAMDFVYSINSDGAKKVILLENDLPDNF